MHTGCQVFYLNTVITFQKRRGNNRNSRTVLSLGDIFKMPGEQEKVEERGSLMGKTWRVCRAACSQSQKSKVRLSAVKSQRTEKVVKSNALMQLVPRGHDPWGGGQNLVEQAL